MTECQLLFQQVIVLYTVYATAFCADVHPPVRCPHDVHHSTAAQALGTTGLTLMQQKEHLVCLLLQLGYNQSLCGCCHQHLSVLCKMEVAHALGNLLGIAVGYHEPGIGCLGFGSVAESSAQRGDPQASVPVFLDVVNVRVWQLRQVAYLERACCCLFQSEDALWLGA